jgi:hypothetical protein
MEKRWWVLGIILILFIVLILIIFSFYFKERNPTSSQEQLYKISSLVDYDAGLCIGRSIAYKPNGFNSGIKLIFRDKITGELIKGYGTLSTIDGSSGFGSENYSCEEGIDSEKVLVSAYAKGYTPLVFIFKYPKNQLATVEVLMIKSCSGGPSFFDNLKVYSEMINNKTNAIEYINTSQNSIYNRIKEIFGLEKEEYNLECVESQMERGGYIKLKGTYKDGSPLEFYYRWGWCSSGGSDCGWSICFSSTSDILFESVKNISCNRVFSRQINDTNICSSEAYDKTEEVQNKCNSGDFQRIDGSKNSLSIIQNSNRCGDSVAVGEFNCLEN